MPRISPRQETAPTLVAGKMGGVVVEDFFFPGAPKLKNLNILLFKEFSLETCLGFYLF